MKRRLAVLALFLSIPFVAGSDETPPPTTDNLLISTSIRPVTSETFLIPRDRIDKRAYLAELFVLSSAKAAVAHRRVLLFPGEPVDSTFDARDLQVAYRFEIDPKARRAKCEVRLTRAGKLVAAHSSSSWLVGTEPGNALVPAE